MCSFDEIKDSLGRADKLIGGGHLSEAIVELRAIEPVVRRRLKEEDFLGFVTIQATLMSLMAGEQSLAQEFATLHLIGMSDHLERMNQQYLDEGNYEKRMSALAAANFFIRAFIPFVENHPRLLLEFDQVSLDEARASLLPGLISIAKKVRPQLDSAGWATWPYPVEVKRRAQYISAQVLYNFGRRLKSYITVGADVEDVQWLGNICIKLLEDYQNDPLLASVYNLIGTSYAEYGDEESRLTAISYFEKSLAILEKAGDKSNAATDRANIAGLLILMAERAEAENNIEAASEYKEKAERYLKLAIRSLRKDYITIEQLLVALSNLGAFYIKQSNFELALKYFRELVDAAHKAGDDDSPVVITALTHIGIIYREQQNFDEAEEVLKRAADSINPNSTQTPGFPKAFIFANAELGIILCHRSKMEEAYLYLSKALERLEAYRSSFLSEVPNQNLLWEFQYVYDAMIHCCATLAAEQEGKGAQAFALIEKVKWRTLTAHLRFMPLRMINPALNKLVAEEERSLSSIVEFILTVPELAVGRPDIKSALRRLEEIWSELEPKFPQYVAIRRQKTIEADEVSDLLDDEVPVLLEFYLNETFDTSLAIVLCKDRPTPGVVRLPATPEEIKKMTAHLRAQDERQSIGEFNSISQTLYLSLIEPLRSFLPDDGRGICIVPYGSLHNIPFSAIYDGEQYLGERHPIVIAPSATPLRWWVNKIHREPETCFIFTPTSNVSTTEDAMPDLDMFAELAEDYIAPLFKSVKIIKPQDATRSRLLKEFSPNNQFSPWDVIHIAGHGVFSPDGGLFSHLVMAGDPQMEDKDLRVTDILNNLRPNATLVTLSACETGVAETIKSDEMLGLAHSFLFSGASSVLASLWYVRQDVGVDLTRHFYAQWLGARSAFFRKKTESSSKIKALQKAQQEVRLKKNQLGFVKARLHPYLWAAFQLYGDWR